MTQREQYLQVMQNLMTELGNFNDRAKGLVQCYVDRAYDSGAANAITNAELAPFGVVQYDLGAAFSTLQAINTLLSGGSVAGTDLYHATVNKWRVL